QDEHPNLVQEDVDSDENSEQEHGTRQPKEHADYYDNWRDNNDDKKNYMSYSSTADTSWGKDDNKSYFYNDDWKKLVHTPSTTDYNKLSYYDKWRARGWTCGYDWDEEKREYGPWKYDAEMDQRRMDQRRIVDDKAGTTADHVVDEQSEPHQPLQGIRTSRTLASASSSSAQTGEEEDDFSQEDLGVVSSQEERNASPVKDEKNNIEGVEEAAAAAACFTNDDGAQIDKSVNVGRPSKIKSTLSAVERLEAVGVASEENIPSGRGQGKRNKREDKKRRDDVSLLLCCSSSSSEGRDGILFVTTTARIRRTKKLPQEPPTATGTTGGRKKEAGDAGVASKDRERTREPLAKTPNWLSGPLATDHPKSVAAARNHDKRGTRGTRTKILSRMSSSDYHEVARLGPTPQAGSAIERACSSSRERECQRTREPLAKTT
ncbi:unnamed protein product, partial [Amoebophrya sp. A25]